jgi:hypothetical protein
MSTRPRREGFWPQARSEEERRPLRLMGVHGEIASPPHGAPRAALAMTDQGRSAAVRSSCQAL